MCGSVPPLPKYGFMAWCSVKKRPGTTLPLAFTVGSLLGRGKSKFVPVLH